jgi:hypothetical protein
MRGLIRSDIGEGDGYETRIFAIRKISGEEYNLKNLKEVKCE